MNKITDIAYDSSLGFRGEGDLYLPENPENAPSALVIHGGGWNSMDRSGLAGVAEFMCEIGFGAFNINYRLLKDAPWPACGDDCLKAANFLIDAGHSAMEALNRSKILVIGGSAGGHLTLMTGLRLPVEKVKGIVAIAPPTDMKEHFEFSPQHYKGFFAKEPSIEDLQKASPIYNIKGTPPPVLCTHSVNDQLVSPSQSEKFVKACREAGGMAEIYLYENPDRNHGIWIEGSSPHRLLPELEKRIKEFITSL
jgi:acetyl esterase/lipase